jgi:hypothetical protein
MINLYGCVVIINCYLLTIFEINKYRFDIKAVLFDIINEIVALLANLRG